MITAIESLPIIASYHESDKIISDMGGKKFCLYQLRDSQTDVVFYVGYGLDYRPFKHFEAAYKKLDQKNKAHNTYKCNKIRKINREGGYTAVDILLLTDDETEAKQAEIRAIAYYGRHDLKLGLLTNKTNGGDGTSGRIFTDDEKAAIGLKSSEIWANRTEEEKAEIAQKKSETKKVEWANRTEEEKAAIALKISETKQKISTTEAIAVCKKQINSGMSKRKFFNLNKDEIEALEKISYMTFSRLFKRLEVKTELSQAA